MNSGAKFVKTFFDTVFWRQHPEAALRYLPIVREIKKLKLKSSKILEIGSGSLGITPYLKRHIDGIDTDFSGPQSKFLTKIKGSAIGLPFRKNSYDVVISSDVLEHLKEEVRKKAIYEQLKVAKKLAIILVPIGNLSQNQDEVLYRHWQKIFGRDSKNQFLLEHMENKLPTTDQILVWIDQSARELKKKYRVKSYPLLNLRIREFIMKTWITKNKVFYYLYLKGYLLILPFLRLANFGNCYRRLFVIEFESSAESAS